MEESCWNQSTRGEWEGKGRDGARPGESWPEISGLLAEPIKDTSKETEQEIANAKRCTRGTRKRPKNWEEECEKAFFRLVYFIQTKQISHPDLIINYDHAGHNLVPMSKMTWSTKGARHRWTSKSRMISVRSAELASKLACGRLTSQLDNRSLAVGSTPSGTLLPFQCIWGGAQGNKVSLPDVNAYKWKEANAASIKFTHGDNRHWASLTTTKEVRTNHCRNEVVAF